MFSVVVTTTIGAIASGPRMTLTPIALVALASTPPRRDPHPYARDLAALLEDADAWAHIISPTDILRQIGSPFADADPSDAYELTSAA
jgi:hypothetical protein